MKTRLAVLVSVALVAGAIIVSADDGAPVATPPAEVTRIPIQSDDMTTWPEVSWEEAVERLQECRVSVAGQTHAGDVFLTMKDARHVRAVEPALNELWNLLGSLPEGCGPGSFWTE